MTTCETELTWQLSEGQPGFGRSFAENQLLRQKQHRHGRQNILGQGTGLPANSTLVALGFRSNLNPAIS
jgi:hypothetical protein